MWARERGFELPALKKYNLPGAPFVFRLFSVAPRKRARPLSSQYSAHAGRRHRVRALTPMSAVKRPSSAPPSKGYLNQMRAQNHGASDQAEPAALCKWLSELCGGGSSTRDTTLTQTSPGSFGNSLWASLHPSAGAAAKTCG